MAEREAGKHHPRQARAAKCSPGYYITRTWRISLWWQFVTAGGGRNSNLPRWLHGSWLAGSHTHTAGRRRGYPQRVGWLVRMALELIQSNETIPPHAAQSASAYVIRICAASHTRYAHDRLHTVLARSIRPACHALQLFPPACPRKRPRTKYDESVLCVCARAHVPHAGTREALQLPPPRRPCR